MDSPANLPGPQSLFDEVLVLAILAGDATAADKLARRWRPRLLRTARRILGNAELAQDVVQEAWVSIARGLPRLREPTRFAGWAYGIVTRRCADAQRSLYRHNARHATLLEESGAISPALDQQSDIDRAFAALPDSQRVAAALFYGEGLTLAEIATAMNVPVGTAKSRLFHARRRLREHLEGDEP